MATPFSEIFDRAIFKFADYSFRDDLTPEERDKVLVRYLISAKTDFAPTCLVDLNDYDLVTQQFNQTLDDEIIEILSVGVAYYWLSYKTLNSRLLKNNLVSKDYHYYSPANLLKEIQTLRQTLGREFKKKIIDYSFEHSNLDQIQV